MPDAVSDIRRGCHRGEPAEFREHFMGKGLVGLRNQALHALLAVGGEIRGTSVAGLDQFDSHAGRLELMLHFTIARTNSSPSLRPSPR